MNKETAISKALEYFDAGYACSQSVLLAFAPQFHLDEKTAALISSGFGGGMGRLREKCGAVTGGFMVLGLAYGNTDPKDMDTKLACYDRIRELNQQILHIHGTCNCGELLEKNATATEVSERKHHHIICRQIIKDVTAKVGEMITEK